MIKAHARLLCNIFALIVASECCEQICYAHYVLTRFGMASAPLEIPSPPSPELARIWDKRREDVIIYFKNRVVTWGVATAPETMD